MEIYARADHLNEDREALWKNQLENFFVWLDHSFFALCAVVYHIVYRSIVVILYIAERHWGFRFIVIQLAYSYTLTYTRWWCKCDSTEREENACRSFRRLFSALLFFACARSHAKKVGRTARVLDPNVTSIHVRFCRERRVHRIDSSQTTFVVPTFPHGALWIRTSSTNFRFSLHVRRFVQKVFSKRASSREAIVCWVSVALLSTLAANN